MSQPATETAPNGDAHKLPLPKRRRWFSILMGVSLLLCGGIIGSSVTVYILFDRLMMTIHEPERIPHRIVGRMRWGLGLNDAQAEKIEAIYTDLQRDLVAVRDRALPDIEREVNEARQAVTEVLTPEQAEEYNRNFGRMLKALLPGHTE
jgi:hypothetical protein